VTLRSGVLGAGAFAADVLDGAALPLDIGDAVANVAVKILLWLCGWQKRQNKRQSR
jgi:hypothetical protein